MSKIIQEIEKQRMTRVIPEFKPGDTVVVQVKVVEGDRERVQAYEGVVIARSNRGLNSSFTVRKISHGEGVERVFQTYSPAISDITDIAATANHTTRLVGLAGSLAWSAGRRAHSA